MAKKNDNDLLIWLFVSCLCMARTGQYLIRWLSNNYKFVGNNNTSTEITGILKIPLGPLVLVSLFIAICAIGIYLLTKKYHIDPKKEIIFAIIVQVIVYIDSLFLNMVFDFAEFFVNAFLLSIYIYSFLLLINIMIKNSQKFFGNVDSKSD